MNPVPMTGEQLEAILRRHGIKQNEFAALMAVNGGLKYESALTVVSRFITGKRKITAAYALAFTLFDNVNNPTALIQDAKLRLAQGTEARPHAPRPIAQDNGH